MLYELSCYAIATETKYYRQICFSQPKKKRKFKIGIKMSNGTKKAHETILPHILSRRFDQIK